MAITGHHHNENCGNPVAYVVSPQNRYLHEALVDLDGEVTKTI
jgi:hypothetical protein